MRFLAYKVNMCSEDPLLSNAQGQATTPHLQSTTKGKHSYITTSYLLTPWSGVLLQNLTGSQLVKKLPAFYGTRRFITAFTSARNLSISWARSIQVTPHIPLPEDPSYSSLPIYAWVLQVVSIPHVFPPKPSTHPSYPPYILLRKSTILHPEF